MTDEEKFAEHQAWQLALKDALAPLLSDGEGIVAMRIFYAVRHKGGDETMGQAGLTPENEVQTGDTLIRHIISILMDPEHNHTMRRVEGAPKPS